MNVYEGVVVLRLSLYRFFQVAAGRSAAAPIQVILSTYSSVRALLTSFDIDAACFCYVPHEQKVWTTHHPRDYYAEVSWKNPRRGRKIWKD